MDRVDVLLERGRSTQDAGVSHQVDDHVRANRHDPAQRMEPSNQKVMSMKKTTRIKMLLITHGLPVATFHSINGSKTRVFPTCLTADKHPGQRATLPIGIG
jgi:hypothetical protein